MIMPDGRYGCCIDTSDQHSKMIWALAGSGTEGGTTYEVPEPRVELPRTWPVAVLDRLVKDYSYWEGRGIAEAIVAPFRGGVATDGQMKGRFVFPIFDAHGEIHGFTGRRLDGRDQMKWKHLSRTATWVWGGIDEVEASGRAILVESIGDALALIQGGVPDVICIFGVTMSQAVLAKLIELNVKEIVIATNRDNERINAVTGESSFPGQDAARRIEKTLLKFFGTEVVRTAHPPEGGVPEGEDGAMVPVKDFGQLVKTEEGKILLDSWVKSLSV